MNNRVRQDSSGDTFADYCFVLGAGVVFLLFANLTIAAIVFLGGGHLSLDVSWIAIGAAVIFVCVLSFRHFKHYVFGALLVLVSAAILIVGSVLITRGIYDISYDGQTYQQEAVIQLSNGWDPVYQYLDPAKIGLDQKWIDYYPKASWVNESSIVLFTHEEQAGKALDLILIVVSMALVYAALAGTTMLRKFDAAVIALVLGANPVSTYQSLGYYLDGQLFSLFLCICALCMIIHAKKGGWALLTLFTSIAIFVNLKFTGIVDAILVLVAFMILEWMEEDERLTGRIMLTGAAALVVGVFLIGFSPYMTNLARYTNPVYPLAGPGAIDLKPVNVPGNFIQKNSLEIMFLSFFAKSGQLHGVGTTATYKIPFTYTADELVPFRYPDPDEGGFGPLFGGAIIIGFLMLFGYGFASLFIKDKKYRGWFEAAFLLMIVVIIMCVVDPISSLARYVPQAYLLAVIPIILFLASRKSFLRLIAYLALVLLFFNSYLIAQSYISYNTKTSAEIGTDLQDLAARSQKAPILVYFNEFKSTRVMLQEAGVNYVTTTNEASCPGRFARILPENTTEFCVTNLEK